MLLPERKVDPSFATVYRQLLERVVLDDDLTHNTAAAIRELAAAVLQSNPVANAIRNDYAETVEYLLSAWQRLKGPRMLDCAYRLSQGPGGLRRAPPRDWGKWCDKPGKQGLLTWMTHFRAPNGSMTIYGDFLKNIF